VSLQDWLTRYETNRYRLTCSSVYRRSEPCIPLSASLSMQLHLLDLPSLLTAGSGSVLISCLDPIPPFLFFSNPNPQFQILFVLSFARFSSSYVYHSFSVLRCFSKKKIKRMFNIIIVIVFKVFLFKIF